MKGPAVRLLLAALSLGGFEVEAFFNGGVSVPRGALGTPPTESVARAAAAEEAAPAAKGGGVAGGAEEASPAPVVAEDGVEYVEEDLGHIFVNNLVWRESKEGEDLDFFKKLGSEHAPPYLWIGCADARVPSNTIMGKDAGAVFTMRNVANLVVNTDANLMAALQYAVTVLKVQHIIVCGHYECGGIKASMVNADHGAPLETWLRNIRDVYRLHKSELDAIEDDDLRHRRLVELNVVEQCINVFKTSEVQRRRIETHEEKLAGNVPYTMPKIHALVFDPATGLLNRLPVDFADYADVLTNIYGLFPGTEGTDPAVPPRTRRRRFRLPSLGRKREGAAGR